MEDRILRLTPSRTLAYTDIGDPAWTSVLFFHGAPSSRLRMAYVEPDFLAARIRVVSPDRPGYGGSTPHPGRRIVDWAADVESLADALNLRRFVVAGHSSGGAYALATATLLPGRISGVITLGGVTDMGWPDAWDDYLESEARLMRLPSLEAVVAECERLFGSDGGGFLSSSGMTFSAPDERLYADERIARLLARSRAESFRQGVIGYANDVFLQGQPWPFVPASIRVPVLVIHGDNDTLLPLAHSRHTAALIPGAEVRVLREHGHSSILSELPRLTAELSVALG